MYVHSLDWNLCFIIFLFFLSLLSSFILCPTHLQTSHLVDKIGTQQLGFKKRSKMIHDIDLFVMFEIVLFLCHRSGKYRLNANGSNVTNAYIIIVCCGWVFIKLICERKIQIKNYNVLITRFASLSFSRIVCISRGWGLSFTFAIYIFLPLNHPQRLSLFMYIVVVAGIHFFLFYLVSEAS